MKDNGKAMPFTNGIRKPRTGWEAQIKYIDRLTGAERGKSKARFPTKSEALAWQIKTKADLQAGRIAGAATETVGAFLNRWLQWRQTHMADKTWVGYDTKLRIHVIPRIGGIRLDNLRPMHIAQLQHAMRSEGRLSTTSIRQTLTMLRTALEYARKTEQTIATNPVDSITRIPAQKYRPKQPTAAEVGAFLTYLQDTGHPLHPAFAFACMLGARQGEVLALRWADIDPATRTVRITKSRTKQRGQTVERAARKTGNDYAAPIPEALWRILTAHKEAQRASAGNVVRLGDPGYVFTDGNGDPLPGNALTDAFRYLKPRTGLTCRVHDFRGFVASQLLAAGNSPAEVRDILGWRDTATLLNYYAQPTAEAGRKAVEALAGLIAHG